MRISIPKKCDHGETITVVTAGIEQTVCQICGNVKMRSVEDAPAAEPEPHLENSR